MFKNLFQPQNGSEEKDARPDMGGIKKIGMSFRSIMQAGFREDATGPSSVTPEGRTTVINKAKEVYPGLVSGKEIVQKLEVVLSEKAGYNNDKTLLASSLCCDEVNRELENELREVYGRNFSMGGLAGFAFGGVTSFGAMAHHIPNDGSCLVVYGPHVGIDTSGNVGKVNRAGRTGSGACCGSAAAALAYCKSVAEGERCKKVNPDDFDDAQQVWVGSALVPHTDRLLKADQPEVELPLALFDAQDELMQRIVQKGCGEVAGEGKIALLGGIQINTPAGVSEYFLPKKFELRNNKGELIEDLLPALMES